MPPDPREEPTRAEWKVLKIVWDQGECAARDVVREAQEHGWSASTVKTLLRRLVAKGHLQTRQIGNSFLYQPSESALKVLCGAADQLLDTAQEGTLGALLSYMVRKSALSEEELESLRAALDRKAPGKRPRRKKR